MSPHRITVIDDSPEILEVLGDALRREGVDVTLLDERSSIDQIAASTPDVLMVDLRLGTDHLPGWQIIRHVRGHPGLLDVPIIVCSAALDQLRTYGGSAVDQRTWLLPKPFSLTDLESVMAEALGLIRARADAGSIMVDVIPEFSANPVVWFAWVESQMDQPAWSELLTRIQPASWVTSEGHPWRLVRTARGVEVRPELVSPFLRFGNQPMVSAIGLTHEVEIELTTQHARWVDRFPSRTFDLAGLGRSMLEERKLPHDNLPALFPAVRGEEGSGADRYTAFRVDEHQVNSPSP
jgi:CheY-like chemotaxis protein